MRPVLTLIALALASPGPGRPSTGVADHRIAIVLSSFKFAPSRITLRAGEAYTLHLVSRSPGSHDFVAKAFLAAARIAPEDRAAIKDGTLAFGSTTAIDIHLIAPAPGVYEFHCGYFMHAALGMRGVIDVQPT